MKMYSLGNDMLNGWKAVNATSISDGIHSKQEDALVRYHGTIGIFHFG